MAAPQVAMAFLPRALAATVLLGLAIVVQTQDYEYDYGRQFTVTTMVFNAFPSQNVTAFVLFEEDRISRLGYGDLVAVNTLLEKHSDFIVQFKTVPKEVLVGEYTDYGFMGEELEPNMEVVLIIQRNTQNPKGGKPSHRVLTSSVDKTDADSSRLYVYNAVWNTKEPDRELNFYGLYLRQNYDGSESESISQLAVDVPMNQGKEIDLEPGIRMEIKYNHPVQAFYSTIASVSDFKHMKPVVHLRSYKAPSGGQKFLVAYGDYPSSSTPAEARILDTVPGNSAKVLVSSALTAITMILATAVLL